MFMWLFDDDSVSDKAMERLTFYGSKVLLVFALFSFAVAFMFTNSDFIGFGFILLAESYLIHREWYKHHKKKDM